MVLEKTRESPLDCKESQPVYPEGDTSWVFIGRTDGEAETPILWPPHAKSWLTGKDPDAGRDFGQEKEMTEDEMVEWHHWLDGHEFRWTSGVFDGQGGLAWCGSWGCKELDMIERLNWTEMGWKMSRLKGFVNEIKVCVRSGKTALRFLAFSTSACGLYSNEQDWAGIISVFNWSIVDLHCVSFRYTPSVIQFCIYA